MQDGEGEREFEDGLHGRVRGWIEVAVERRPRGWARQGAGDGDFAVGVGGYGLDLLLERLLWVCGGGESKKEKQCGAHGGKFRASSVVEEAFAGCGTRAVTVLAGEGFDELFG
jgi:hypothetical protein